MDATSTAAPAYDSLYTRSAAPSAEGDSNPFPPGTIETARIETVDNDVAALMLGAGVVR